MKDKKPSKKKNSGPKKEITRPSHKKPRPKKYVEAKIPQLPPVPTEQIPITKEVPPTTVETPLPDDERLTQLINVANKALEDVANHAREKFEHNKMLFDLNHLYEECPQIESRIDRNNLRFWFKANKNAPIGIDVAEEVYPEDLVPVIQQMEKALSPQPSLTSSIKKTLWSKAWSFISRKK